jgi:hypothetical protein
VALAEAIAALFVAGAVTDLRPYLGQERATASGDALASRTAPRMRPAEPPARTALAAPAIPAGPPAAAADGMGTRSTAHSAG